MKTNLTLIAALFCALFVIVSGQGSAFAQTPEKTKVIPPFQLTVLDSHETTTEVGVGRFRNFLDAFGQAGLKIVHVVKEDPAAKVKIKFVEYANGGKAKETLGQTNLPASATEIMCDMIAAGYRPATAFELASVEDTTKDLAGQTIISFGTVSPITPGTISLFYCTFPEKSAAPTPPAEKKKAMQMGVIVSPETGWPRKGLILAVVESDFSDIQLPPAK